MKLKILHLTTLAASLATASCTTTDPGKSAPATTPVLTNLLRTDLKGCDNTEVIVSRVSIPPNTSLPKHWHPGEEFAYVIEGSVTLWQKGKRDTLGNKGEALVVPLKQIHTAVTGDDGVELVIFRVHEKGQPERIPAN